MKIEDTNKLVELFLNWLESKVAEANPKMPDMWVIKINNDEITNKDRKMISLLDNSTSDFISLLYICNNKMYNSKCCNSSISSNYTTYLILFRNTNIIIWNYW